MEKVVYYDRRDAGYPNRLRPYSNMPEGLYLKGNLVKEELPTVAIVGARACSPYGRGQARRFARELSEAGVQVISGLASGVDTAAHEGALEGKTPTFAVFGCGVNICYPRENYPLMCRILEQGGGILSEFPEGTPPQAWHFPKRNRVISALADLVLVIEARKKSGSLITADYALEQGKSVYALPGRVGDALSEGCNRLIAQGAGIAVDTRTLLEELGVTGVKETPKQYFGRLTFSEEEKTVIEAVKKGFHRLEELQKETGWTVSKLSMILVQLQLFGVLREEGKHRFFLME